VAVFLSIHVQCSIVFELSDRQTNTSTDADNNDTRVMRDGKHGCWPSERKRKVGERGLRPPKNQCYDGAEQRQRKFISQMNKQIKQIQISTVAGYQW